MLCVPCVHCWCDPQSVAIGCCGSSLEDVDRSPLLHREEVSAMFAMGAASAAGVGLMRREGCRKYLA